MKKLNKKGFTLTEMIVVIAIIGILAAVLIPSVVIYVNRAKESNDNQLAASMTDEIERYCIESNIEQKNLKASDVRSILVGKGYDLAPSRKVYTYVYNVSEKIVEVIRLDDISDSITVSESDEPAEYADGMYIIGKGKSDFEQCINDLYNGVLNIDKYSDKLNAKQAELITEFTSNTLYIKNNEVLEALMATQTFANNDDTYNVVFCEMVFNVPAQLANYVDHLGEFSVPEIVCSIDNKAKAVLSNNISNLNSIRSYIKCATISPQLFTYSDGQWSFQLGNLVVDTVSQSINVENIGYTSIKNNDDTYTLYYVAQASVKYFKMEGLAAEGNAIFLIEVKEEISQDRLYSLGRLYKSELEKLNIRNSELFKDAEIAFPEGD